MIEIEGIRHRILDIPHLRIGEGRTVLIGPNGAGKSTLLQLCAGVELPKQGTVRIDGHSPREADIGWVDENPERTLLFERVSDEIASSLRFRTISCREIREETEAVIGELGISALAGRSTWQLSAGEKVLVALGAALAGRPPVVILDEVDSHLDPRTAERMYGILEAGRRRHLLIATQQMEIAACAEWVLYLEGGRIGYQGSPREVFLHLEPTCFYPASWRNGG